MCFSTGLSQRHKRPNSVQMNQSQHNAESHAPVYLSAGRVVVSIIGVMSEGLHLRLCRELWTIR
jgi:hypothetical protein